MKNVNGLQSVLSIFDINGHNNITGNSFSQTKISGTQEIVCDKYGKPLYLSGLDTDKIIFRKDNSNEKGNMVLV